MLLGILAKYPGVDGYILSLFRVFANSLRFLKKGAVKLLDPDSGLVVRQLLCFMEQEPLCRSNRDVSTVGHV